jgi:hypothetical protein
MATPIQSINLQVINATTSFTDLNSISIINQSTDKLDIIGVSPMSFVTLLEGQTLTITASTGFVLPTLTLDGSSINASVITT